MKTAGITAVIVAILIAIGGFMMYQTQAPENPDQTATSTDQGTANIPDGWSQYHGNYLSFAHPDKAEISEEAGRIKIQIIGPNNEPNTEITDGITTYVRPTSTNGSSLQSVAQAVFERNRKSSEAVLSQPTSTRFVSRSGTGFSLRSLLGSKTKYIVIPADKPRTALIINYTASGEQAQQYVNQLETIVKSMQVIALPTITNQHSDRQKKQATPSTSTQNPDKNTLAQKCEQANGNWLSEYRECENVTESWCENQGGSFNACASACRHNPDAEMCTQQCVFVCSF